MKLFITTTITLLLSSYAWAGRVVQHQHKCPGIFRGLDICANYKMSDVINIDPTTEVPLELEFYTWDSAYSDSGNREYVEIPGQLVTEIMMAHDNGTHMSMPIELEKISKGRYRVHGVYISMPGMWGVTVDLFREGFTLAKRAELFFYVYP